MLNIVTTHEAFLGSQGYMKHWIISKILHDRGGGWLVQFHQNVRRSSISHSRILHVSFFSPFPIHWTYFWVWPPQMALLGFFHVISLLILPVHSYKTWIHRLTGIVRERSHKVGKGGEGRRKKAQKKPLGHDRDLNPQTLSVEPSVLSIRPQRPCTST